MTEAHSITLTQMIREYYPAHEPREADPHYKYFLAARNRLEKAGKLTCWVCGATSKETTIELHHTWVEFSLINGVDIEKFIHEFPEFHIADDEMFYRWVEEEGNLTPLCVAHHRGIVGVHVLPYPQWVAQKVWKDNVPLPGEKVTK